MTLEFLKSVAAFVFIEIRTIPPPPQKFINCELKYFISEFTVCHGVWKFLSINQWKFPPNPWISWTSIFSWYHGHLRIRGCYIASWSVVNWGRGELRLLNRSCSYCLKFDQPRNHSLLQAGVSIISKNGVFYKSSYLRFEFFIISLQNCVFFYKKR